MKHCVKLLLLIWLFLSVACLSSQTGPQIIEEQNDIVWTYHENWSENVRFPEWGIDGQGSRGVGFLRPEQRDIHPQNRDPVTKFQTNRHLFEVELLLSSYKEADSTALVSLFVNYEQVSFSLDGKSGLLHHVVLESNQELEIPLSVPLQNEGWHDLFVAVFYSPEAHPTDAELRLPGSGIHLGGYRTVVCAVSCEKPETALAQYMGEPTDGTKFSAIRALLLCLGDEEPQRRLLPMATVEPNVDIAVELWAINRSDEERHYTVIPMYDFLQVPFTENGDNVMLLTMPSNSSLLLPGTIKGSEEGMHEFFFITLSDPYQNIEDMADPFVKSEMRTGIIVEN
jgi:hypothetical protein